MNVYTHNTADSQAPMTFIKMVVTDAPLEELGLGEDWFQVDPQEVEDEEFLAGTSYPKLQNLTQIDLCYTESGKPFRRYGRL